MFSCALAYLHLNLAKMFALLSLAMFSRGSEYDGTIFSTQKILELRRGFGKIFTSGQHYNLFEVVRREIEFGAIVIMRKGENWVNGPISACLWIEDKIAEFSICQKSLFEQLSIFWVSRGKCSYRLKSKIKDRLNEETVYFLYFQSACICMSVKCDFNDEELSDRKRCLSCVCDDSWRCRRSQLHIPTDSLSGERGDIVQQGSQ